MLTMAEIDQNFIKEILGNVASVLSYGKWDYVLENFNDIGQNYFGILVRVRLIGKINVDVVNTHLVLKLAPADERYRVSGAVTLMFAREIYMYSTILHQYMAQQTTIQTRFIVPSCYYLSKEHGREAIALSDMSAEGYAPYTRNMFLDADHVIVSLQSLAILHAHSFILKTRSPTLYEEATKTCLPLTEKSNKRFMEILRDRNNKAIEKLRDTTTYKSVLETVRQNLVKSVEAAFNSVEQTCICHGDIWKENILFQYCDGKPVSACLIDYQTARMCSPAFDVLYLITSSTDTALRREHFNNLLDVYYEQLVQVLNEAGLEVPRVYCRESFEKDMKTVAPACFVVATCALWLASGLQQEGHVRSKVVFKNEEEEVIAVEYFKSLIKAIIDDFCSYGYFTLDLADNE